jgi:hypothetical protein
MDAKQIPAGQHHKPNLYFLKIRKEHTHQGVRKVAERIITTHDTRIMPKYFKDRGWVFAKAERRVVA